VLVTFIIFLIRKIDFTKNNEIMVFITGFPIDFKADLEQIF